MHGTDIVSAIIARKTIASTEVTWLRQEVFKDGVTDDKEAEVIFRLNEECTEKDESWDQLYVDVLTDYFVWQASPRGYVDEGHARYLMQRIAGNNRIESSPELELLVNVIHWADHCPPELAELVLMSVRESVLDPDEAAYGRGRRPRVVDAVDVELIKRAIYAPATAGGITVTRLEAEVIFDINSATDGAANDPAWKQLFVYAIGNHLMFPRPHTPPPPPAEVVRREEWLKERRSIGGLFKQIGAETLNTGAGKIEFGARFKLALKAMGGPVQERDLDAETREAKVAYERETIDEEEANWLFARLRRDGDLHENERALLTFIRNTSPKIHSSLDKFMTEAGI